jgi:hypothetical protein
MRGKDRGSDGSLPFWRTLTGLDELWQMTLQGGYTTVFSALYCKQPAMDSDLQPVRAKDSTSVYQLELMPGEYHDCASVCSMGVLNQTTRDWHSRVVTLSEAKGLAVRFFAALRMTLRNSCVAKYTNVMCSDLVSPGAGGVSDCGDFSLCMSGPVPKDFSYPKSPHGDIRAARPGCDPQTDSPPGRSF